MKRETDNDDLLDDVLAEATPPAFRSTLLEATLQRARRRRRMRHVGRAALPVALVTLGAMLAWWNGRRPPDSPVPMPTEPPCRIVRTQPLPSSAVVATQTLPPKRIVASVPFSAVVHTTPGSGGFRLISDEELLALVGRPAALVRVGPHAQELIFPSPATGAAPPR